MRGATALVVVLSLWGCGLRQSEVFRLRLEVEAAAEGEVSWGVLGGSSGESTLALWVQRGSAGMGIPFRLWLRLCGDGGEQVREIPGECWAAVPMDTLLGLLIRQGAQAEWVFVGKTGQEWRQDRAEALPGVPVPRFVGSLGEGRWVCANAGQLWLADSGGRVWRQLAESVSAVLWEREDSALVWLQRQGQWLWLWRMGRDGEAVPLGAVDSSAVGEEVRLWALARGIAALAWSEGEGTRVQVWQRERGRVRRQERVFVPAPLERVALCAEGEAVSVYWLEPGGDGWRLWRRWQGQERVVASFSGHGEARMASLGSSWVVAVGEEIALGDAQGIRVRGYAQEGIALGQLQELGGGSFLAVDGRRIQLWQVVAIPVWQRVAWWAGYVLAGGVGVLLLLLGGGAAWRRMRRWWLRQVLEGVAGHARLWEGKAGEPFSAGGTALPAERPALYGDEHGRWWMVLPLPFGARWALEVTEAVQEQRIWLAGILTHELRGEVARLELALKQGDDEAARAVLRRLRLRLDGAAELVRTRPRFELLALEELWGAVAALFEDLTQAGVLRWEPPVVPVYLRGDRRWLLHALSNAVENARKALQTPEGRLPEGAQIVIRGSRQLLSQGAPWVVLEVCDTGPGLGGGVRKGLGMELIESIVRAHGGRVEWISPWREGGGTCVRMWFPRAFRR